MHQFTTPIAVAAGGMLAQVAALIAETSNVGIAPWAQGAGAVSAVAALAYMAKKIANGDLVALNTAVLLQKSEARELKLQEWLEESHEREDTYKVFLLNQKLRS